MCVCVFGSARAHVPARRVGLACSFECGVFSVLVHVSMHTYMCVHLSVLLVDFGVVFIRNWYVYIYIYIYQKQMHYFVI